MPSQVIRSRRVGAPRAQRSVRSSTGFAMIEVLVTLVILLFGLLGLAGVSARANVTEMESYQRVQAVLLMQDMVDRLNANRKVASCYSNGVTGVQLGLNATGSGYTGVPACAAGNAQQNKRASADLTEWDTMLQGSAELSGTSKIGAMIGAVGCVTQMPAPAVGVYQVSVSWQGLAATAAPPTVTAGFPDPCGKGLYKNPSGTADERLHRVVSVTVQI